MSSKNFKVFFLLSIALIVGFSLNFTDHSYGATEVTNGTLAASDAKPATVSQSDILSASSTVNSYISKNSKLPNSVEISGYSYSMPEFTYLLSKTIQYKYKKSNNDITAKYSIKDPTNPNGDNIKGKIASKNYYKNAVSVASFINEKNQAPNYVSTTLGKMPYQTAIYAFVKILAWSKSNKNALPTTVSLNVKSTSSLNVNVPKSNYNTNTDSSNSGDNSNTGTNSSSSSSLSQSLIWKASKEVKNYVVKNGKLPDYVTISNNKYSMPEFMRLVSLAIVYKVLNRDTSVSIKKNVKKPSSPSGVTINKKISKTTYYSLAKNIKNYIDAHGQAPNYVSSSYGKIQYQTILYGLAIIGDYINTKNKVPGSLTLKIKSSSSLNKYNPAYSSSSSSNSGSSSSSNSSGSNTITNGDKNAIWVHSGDMKNVDLSTLSKNGIGNIFLYESVFNEYGNTVTLSWIKTASDLGIKVHIWMPCFYNTSSGKWINPIDTSTKQFNQNYFNTLIAKASSYAKMSGVAGIHLDYLRYPGTANSFNYSSSVNGVTAITEFTRQLSVAIDSINPKLILSGAIMPETTNNPKYYGQDPSQLGNYLDVIIPMVYKGNYKQGTSWIESTIKWFVANSAKAEVWGGLQSYKSDSDVTKLSSSELSSDSKAVMNGGANGVALFRWGLVNFFNLLSI